MSEQEKVTKATMEDVFDFEIVINGVEYPNSFDFDVKVDRTNLVEEFADHSKKYAYWSTLCALAKDQEARDKRKLEVLYAITDGNVRQELIENKVKFTEKMVENSVKTDKEYQLQHLRYLKSKCLADRLKGMEQAFAARKEMLISLGAHDRIGATDVRVLGRNVKENARRKSVDEIEEELDELVE